MTDNLVAQFDLIIQCFPFLLEILWKLSTMANLPDVERTPLKGTFILISSCISPSYSQLLFLLIMEFIRWYVNVFVNRQCNRIGNSVRKNTLKQFIISLLRISWVHFSNVLEMVLLCLVIFMCLGDGCFLWQLFFLATSYFVIYACFHPVQKCFS